jgi:hypothetical protein
MEDITPEIHVKFSLWWCPKWCVGGVVAFRKRRIDEASGENTGGS